MDGTPRAVTSGAHWYCWQCCVGLAAILAAEDGVLVVMTTTGRAREITRNTGGKQLFTALTARSGRRTAPAAAILTRRRSE